MYSCKLFGSYPRNHEYARGFHKNFSWLTFKKVNLPAPKFSSRMTISELNNGPPKTGVVNMSTPP